MRCHWVVQECTTLLAKRIAHDRAVLQEAVPQIDGKPAQHIHRQLQAVEHLPAPLNAQSRLLQQPVMEIMCLE